MQGLGLDLSVAQQSTLYLPQSRKRRLFVPEVAHTMKVIYFKGQPYGAGPELWFGDILRCHYNVDIDEPGRDGISVRDQIHLWLTGKCERAGYKWVWQGSDERQGTTIIEEWPEFQHNEGRWNRFVRRRK